MLGFTYSTSAFLRDSAGQLAGSDKLASCSAAISLHDFGREERILAIGGRYLPNAPGLTSADVEYDGLIFGLDWLVHAFFLEQENDPSISVTSERNSIMTQLGNDGHRLSGPKVVIRGDCKTVIDQLNSRSVPRKMEEKYIEAMDRIQSLKGMFAKYQQRTVRNNFGAADASISQDLKICFEHVPRENNYLCDALCKLIVNQKQVEIVESIEALIRLGEVDAAKKISTKNNAKVKRVKRPKRKRTCDPKSEYFQQALAGINGPRLCHSSQLALACQLALASIRQNDAAILANLSAFFLRMSRRWSQIYYREDASDCVGRDTLRQVSIACDGLAEGFMGASMDGSTIAGAQDLVHLIDSVFEFCTRKKSQGNKEHTDLTIDDTVIAYHDVDITHLNMTAAESLMMDGQIEQMHQCGCGTGFWKVYGTQDSGDIA